MTVSYPERWPAKNRRSLERAAASDLERIYTICRDAPPPGYQGYRMALSDVVELYDDSGSEFYYCDRVGFQPIRFEQKQDPCINMTL